MSDDIEEFKRKNREFRKKREEQERALTIPRLKEETSGIDMKDSEWYRQTHHLCVIVNRACDAFFRRRQIDFKYTYNNYETDKQSTDQTIPD